MSKLNKDVLINLLHTNAGEESLRKSISRANISHFARTLSDDIVSLHRDTMSATLMVNSLLLRISMSRPLKLGKLMKLSIR